MIRLLPQEVRDRVQEASGVVIVDDNARRQEYSHTESVDPVQLVHFGSSWMKFTSCPSKEKKRMQLQGLAIGASRGSTRWGSSGSMVRAQSSSTLTDNNSSRNMSHPRENQGSMALRRITSDSTMFSGAFPKQPSRELGLEKPQRRSSAEDDQETGGDSNATWGSPPQQRVANPLMKRLGPPVTGSPGLRHAASETAISQKFAAPRLPSRRGSALKQPAQIPSSNSTSGLRMPQRRGSGMENASWDSAPLGASASTISSQSMSSTKVSPKSLIRRFHPSMAPSGVKRRSPKRSPATFSKHKDSFLLASVGPLYEVDEGFKPRGPSSGMENASWGGSRADTTGAEAGRALMGRLAASRSLAGETKSGMPSGINHGIPSGSNHDISRMSNATLRIDSNNDKPSVETFGDNHALSVVGGQGVPGNHNTIVNPLLQRAGMSRNPILSNAASKPPITSLPTKTTSGVRRTTSDAGPSTQSPAIPTTTTTGRRFSLGPAALQGGLKIPIRRSSIDCDPEQMPSMKGGGLKSDSYLCALSIIAEKSKSHDLTSTDISTSTFGSNGNDGQTSGSQLKIPSTDLLSADGSSSTVNAPVSASDVSTNETHGRPVQHPLDQISSKAENENIGDRRLVMKRSLSARSMRKPQRRLSNESTPVERRRPQFDRGFSESALTAGEHPLDQISSKAENENIGDRRLVMKRSLSARSMRKPQRRLSNESTPVERRRPQFDRGFSESALTAGENGSNESRSRDPKTALHRKPTHPMMSPSKQMQPSLLPVADNPCPSSYLTEGESSMSSLPSLRKSHSSEQKQGLFARSKENSSTSVALTETETSLSSLLPARLEEPVVEKKDPLALQDLPSLELMGSESSHLSLKSALKPTNPKEENDPDCDPNPVPLGVTELARKKMMPPRSPVRERRERPLEDLFPPVSPTKNEADTDKSSARDKSTQNKPPRRRMNRKSSLDSLAGAMGLRRGIIGTRSVETMSSSTVSTVSSSEPVKKKKENKKRPNHLRRIASSLGIGGLRKGFTGLTSKRSNPKSTKTKASPETTPRSTPPVSPKKLTGARTAGNSRPTTRRHSINTVSSSDYFSMPKQTTRRRNSMDFDCRRKDSSNMIDMVDEAELLRRQKSIRLLCKTIKHKTTADRQEFLNRVDGHAVKKSRFRRRNTLSNMPRAAANKTTTRRRNSLSDMLLVSHHNDVGGGSYPLTGSSPPSALKFSVAETKTLDMLRLANLEISMQ